MAIAYSSCLHNLQTLTYLACLQAYTEAAALGNMRGQVAELQHMLAGMGQQVVAAEAMRRNDAQVRPILHRMGTFSSCYGMGQQILVAETMLSPMSSMGQDAVLMSSEKQAIWSAFHICVLGVK